jgi:glucose-1-phosphate adenylyltransferase
MGVYIFAPDVLVEALYKDAADDESGHSLGGDIIPRLVGGRAAHMYDFRLNEVPGALARDRSYWREVGTIDAYFNAHMDLCAVHPVFNLYNQRWPILTRVPCEPPAKFLIEDGDLRVPETCAIWANAWRSAAGRLASGRRAVPCRVVG